MFVSWLLPSCESQSKTSTPAASVPITETKQTNEPPAPIAIGEDKSHFDAYATNIYASNDSLYVVLDFVAIKYKNVDERIIENNQTRLRKYRVDSTTLIVLKNCQQISSRELLKQAPEIIANRKQVVVGQASNGTLSSINFGCYE